MAGSSQRINATNLSSGGAPSTIDTSASFVNIEGQGFSRWTSDGQLQSGEGGCLASTGGQVLI